MSDLDIKYTNPAKVTSGAPIACPECGGAAAWRGDGTFRTAVGYIGKEACGKIHDDNCLTRVYKCSNEHLFIVSRRNRCTACDWVGKPSCWCHKGDKVDEWP